MATDEQSPTYTDPGASAQLSKIPTLTSVLDGYTEADGPKPPAPTAPQS